MDLKDSDLNSWKLFSQENQLLIEEAYINDKKTIELNINKTLYVIDFVMFYQYPKNDKSKQRKIKRYINESLINEINSDYEWFFNANDDPFDVNKHPNWAPYTVDINKIIENKFINGIFCFEVLIDKDVYIIDINRYLQIKKSDKNKQRPPS